MKKKFRKKVENKTEVKTLSMHYKREKAIVSVAYNHVIKVDTTTPSGKTNTLGDITNFTLEDKVRVPRLIPLLGDETRKVVNKLAFLDASEISNHYKQIDWRQARALKAWRTRRGHTKPVIQVT
jgi:hypothetical protein